MSAPSLQRYDALPYHSAPYAETHPRSLRTLAALLNVETAPLESARVLELGCAGGGNLIPIAEEAPQARFLGIDLSERHIEAANLRVQQLALANIEFCRQSLTELGSADGEFDYIIAHGLFSWTPPEVRASILELCRDLLAPQGVAVISYNAYPGCHARDQVRAMMRHHVANIEDPNLQIEEAKGLLRFMLSQAKPGSAYRTMLEETLNLLKATNNKSYFYHDFLEDFNQPFYLHEFNTLLHQHQLQLLSETRLFRWQVCDLDPAATAPFAELPYAEREQYLDYLRNTPFHSHAICREAVTIDRQATLDKLPEMHFQWKYECRDLPDRLTPKVPLKFSGKRMTFSTRSAIGQAAMMSLGSRPARHMDFEQLLERSIRLLDAPLDAAHARRELSEELYCAVGHDLLEVYLDPPNYAETLPEFPQVGNNARMQAAEGNVVTNRCHRYVRFDDLGRFLLLYLDGRHDRAALCRRVEEGVADGRILLKPGPDGTPLLPPGGMPALVDETLVAVSNSAVLI